MRLIGSAPPSVEKLGSHRGVVASGWVPSIEAELERADMVAVPMPFGGASGSRSSRPSRIASRSSQHHSGRTALDVTARRHLMLAVTPVTFADACVDCVDLLTDERKRLSLVEEAEDLFRKKYQWCDIADSIRVLATSVFDGSN